MTPSLLLAIGTLALAAAPGRGVAECRNIPRQDVYLLSATIIAAERVCDGVAEREIHVSIFPKGTPIDRTIPGNLLVFEAWPYSARRLMYINAVESPAGIRVAYDARVRVISRHPRVGPIEVRLIADSADYPSVGPLPIRPAAEGCPIERRGDDVAPAFTVFIIKRACAGLAPTIEAFVSVGGAAVDFANQGNALVIDASADSAGQPLALRVIRPEGRFLVFDVDSRARVLFTGPPINGIPVTVVGGQTP